MSSYKTLATIYETLMKDCDYEQWSQYLLSSIKKYTNGTNGLDLACGSGKMTRLLSGFGFKMLGGDISQEMLSQAKALSVNNKQNINYFLADLNNLQKYGSFDFVTIINDGINYVKQDKLLKVFKGVYKNLKKGGILLFDVSSKYKLENVIGNNLFGEDWDDFTYLWFNKLYPDRVEMDLTFFIKEGDRYIRQEEKHIQYIHTAKDLLVIAQQAGFIVLEADQEDAKQRLNFILRRN